MSDIRTVDLNNADVEELKALKGVRQGRAEEIVRYRTEHGPFTDVEQLGNVPHVGNMPAAELEAVKQKLCIRPGGARKPRVEQDI
ncbi:helix-hairpin-helix domain-containing protein [Bradyrhizobium sp. 139]|uniref:ComEA family DNA-binding protein n=1 Tax=Bradyrhizobium sp. 139 TaxID=2782616 RepID=UPI001FFB09E8|nr:helix-hairpin-helix domain-containing protein [Bradyrhizobium sp. 139]MCK1739365.1 helix-hairpin-helix domain-containing protein [Bradyrhizobium sp. 139]